MVEIVYQVSSNGIIETGHVNGVEMKLTSCLILRSRILLILKAERVTSAFRKNRRSAFQGGAKDRGKTPPGDF